MTFKYTTIVDYADTDAGGVVYHSRYLDMAERARSAWLRSMGTSNSALQQQGYLFVMRDVHIKYKQPARLDDELTVSVEPFELRGSRLQLEHYIRRNNDFIASLTVQLACLNAAGRPVRIPGFLNKIINVGQS